MGRKRTLYDVLEVPRSSSSDEIKAAWRRQARRFHPDSAADGEADADAFQRVQEAWSILSDASLRKVYDQQLDVERQQRERAVTLQVSSSHPQLALLDEPQMFYVTVDVQATLGELARPALNLCMVIDRSQSMAGARIQQAKEAALFLIDHLTDADTLSVVVFSDRARRVINGLAGRDRAAAKSAIFGVEPSGGTELLQGFREGVAAIREHRDDTKLDHVILLTDGRTYGDEEGCRLLASQLAEEKIGVTLLGLGHEWNDALLDDMAARGAGHSACIDSPARLVQVIEERFQRLSHVVARDLKLRCRTGHGAALADVYRLVPDIARVRVDNAVMNLGTLESDRPIRLLIEMTLVARPGDIIALSLHLDAELLDGGDRVTQDDEVIVECTEEPRSQVSLELIETLARIAAYQVQEKAVADLARGDIPMASRRLESLSTHLLGMGENELARAVQAEAGNLRRTGILTDEGRIKMRYGTRALALPPRRDDGSDS